MQLRKKFNVNFLFIKQAFIKILPFGSKILKDKIILETKTSNLRIRANKTKKFKNLKIKKI